MWGPGTAVLLLAASLGTLGLLVGTTFAGFAWLIVPLVIVTLLLAEGFRRTEPRAAWLPAALLAASVGVAVASVLTGVLNGLSDEPYSTPSYAPLGLSMYTTPVSFTYVQYGRLLTEHSYDVYLPALTYVQLPGLDYRWVSLLAWGGVAYLLRKDPLARAGWASPWIAVLAANGQNDFVPLLAVTVALTVPLGRAGWAAEALALGLKQFANVLVFGYHLARREYRRAAAAVGLTLAILLPFLWVDPGAVWCHVVLGDPGSGCATHSAAFFLFKRNYWLYPAWTLLVYHRPIRTLAGRAATRLRLRRGDSPNVPSAPPPVGRG